MRVLQIGKFYPPPFGGIETVVATLVHELRADVQTDLLVANDSRRAELIEQDGYRIHKLPTLFQLAGTPVCPTMPLLVRRLFRRRKHDLVHLHFPNPMAHLAASVLPRKVPLVISWHSDIVRQRRLLRLYRPLLNRLLARTAAVVAATPRYFSSSPQLDRQVEARRRFVVPYGLDVSRFEIDARRQASVASIRQRWPGKFLVFCLGRHVRYKGLEYLIGAMAALDSAVLLLGGTGPLTPELAVMARSAGVEDRVVFLGCLAEHELPLYYAAADVFCLPSVEPSEAFGLVQLEAMACRKPIVSCELHNSVSYVNQDAQTGFVVPPCQPAALAAAIARLLSNPDLARRMGEAGYRRVSTCFSLVAMRRGMLDVYEHVLGSRLHRPTCHRQN